MHSYNMRKHCCGPDGKPDLEKMRGFMEKEDKAGKLDAVSWALFFVWVGVAWIAELGLGVGLLGVGVITLGTQLVRKFMQLKVEGFWLFVGTMFALGGIWELANVEVALVPLLLILGGLALLAWIAWQWWTGDKKAT